MNHTTMGEGGDGQSNYVASKLYHFVLDIPCTIMIICSSEDEDWLCQT
jgi:hypothetical protein